MWEQERKASTRPESVYVSAGEAARQLRRPISAIYERVGMLTGDWKRVDRKWRINVEALRRVFEAEERWREYARATHVEVKPEPRGCSVNIEWGDYPGPRMRSSWLLLRKDGRLHRFIGKTIPGIVAVIDAQKQGKWSGTKYTLQLADGVAAIPGHAGWEMGTFRDGLEEATRKPARTWTEAAEALDVTVAELRRLLSDWEPGAIMHWDKVDEDLADIEEEAETSHILSVSFGSPTNRSAKAGFWQWPVRIIKDGEEIARLVPGDKGWATPQVDGPVRVIDVECSPGMHGGYVSLRLVAPEGAKAYHVHPDMEIIQQ